MFKLFDFFLAPFKASILSLDGGGGGQSAPTQSTVTNTNIPEYARPYVETMLGAGLQQMFQTSPTAGGGTQITGFNPYTPYSSNPADYVAGFSPLQQQVQANAANLQMPGQFNTATQMANMAGQGGLNTANQSLGYGGAGFQSGQAGQNLGVGQGAYYGGMGAGYGGQAAGLGMAGAQQAQQNAQQAANAAYGYGGMGAGYGAQAAGLAGRATGYGDLASQIGQMGLQAQGTGQDITRQSQALAQQQAAAGQNYAQQATSPGATAAYMSPYMQNVVDVQQKEAQRQADIASTQRGAQAARSGAFGGARQAIENAEANRNLQTQLGGIQAQGLQNAYQQAQQNQQFGANLGLQGLGGAQSGLGTALQGGQLGLSGIGTALQGQQAALSGLGQAGNLYGMGMQGAQAGLQGVGQAINAGQLGLQGTGQGIAGLQAGMQGAQTGLQGTQVGLQGTAQGMQGAQAGMQGVQGAQAGYGLLGQQAQNLANIGTGQLGAQQNILNLQNTVGGQQQNQMQNIINNAINNYAMAQQNPQNQLTFMNSLLRGLPMQSTTAQSYQAAPSAMNQLTSLGLGAAGLGRLYGGAKGGLPKDFKKKRASGLDTLGMYNVLKGSAA